MLKTKKRRQAQLDDSQDDVENSGDEPLSDAGTDVLPQVLGSKSARPKPRAPKRTKRVSRPKYPPVNCPLIDISPSQSSNSTQPQERRGTIQGSYSPQVQTSEDIFAQDLHQNAYTPNERTSHGPAASQQMSTLNQGYDFQSGSESVKVFNGDSSIVSSDSEGLAAIGCEYN